MAVAFSFLVSLFVFCPPVLGSSNTIFTADGRAQAILENRAGVIFPISENCQDGSNCEDSPLIQVAWTNLSLPLTKRFYVRLNSDYHEIIQEGCQYESRCADYAHAILTLTSSARTRAYYVLDRIGGALGLSRTLVPANIDPALWGELAEPGANLRRPENNIYVAAVLISRLMARVEDPTIEKIATLYNFVGSEHVTWYGHLAAKILEARLWEE